MHYQIINVFTWLLRRSFNLVGMGEIYLSLIFFKCYLKLILVLLF
jgi:hypothetical protein